MNLILTVFQVVAPVFTLALIGFIWVKLDIEYRVEFVTKLAMTVSIPCLIFVALMKTEVSGAALTAISLASIVAYAGVTLVMFLFIKINRLNAPTYLAPLIFGNTGNLGIPLALFAFGEVGLQYAVVSFAIMAVYSFTAGIWIVSGGGNPLKALKEPMVGATILGGIFLWQGWETPVWITNALELLGQMGIPLMLITLGVALARLSPAGLLRAFWLSLAKVIICAAIAWTVAVVFKLDDVAFAVLVLQVSTPVAVTSYLIAQKYGANAGEVAGMVVASTFLSIAFIPILLAFLL
ncbi:auxin efflux carrier family protein [Rhodobacteraceae bacterium HTCC2150]|nr:auxin efflux carrier family protein [Rhodobacteraceae bacterium HTCC2150]